MFPLLDAAIEPSDYPAMLRVECTRFNRVGLTTCSEMVFDPVFRPLVERPRGNLMILLRNYESLIRSCPPTPSRRGRQNAALGGDQYLLGVQLTMGWHHHVVFILSLILIWTQPRPAPLVRRRVLTDTLNYTREQLAEIVGAYFPLGWPLTCHLL